MPSGLGYLGGYGNVARSAYATPAELGAKPWALDFNIESGWPSFPTAQRVLAPMHWQPGDWDPGLRHWSLPFDERLQEWLQDVDLAAPSVLAAREFAAQFEHWQAKAKAVGANGIPYQCRWINDDDLAWVKDENQITRELIELELLMKQERAQYLDEAWMQSDNVAAYFVHFLGMDTPSKPWTAELIRCGLSIGNLVYMHYKSRFRRVRPSTLCPGLVPPWGPPRHPAFPSGHSFLGHFIALLLLDAPGLAQRYGVFDEGGKTGRQVKPEEFTAKDAAGYGDDMRCPLLWLAWRLARNRERIGVHYRSDSSASRSLAFGIWQAVTKQGGELPSVNLPTLHDVLRRASAEWPVA